MCKFKTGTNTDYNKRAGFNIRICQNKVQIQFVPWFVLHKNVVQCIAGQYSKMCDSTKNRSTIQSGA